MFNKIEFSDLYKFLTSIGLLFIVSAFIIPWLLINQNTGLFISQAEYNLLLEKSKELVIERISFSLFIIQILPWISGALLIIGIILTFFGLRKWKKKQKMVDETDMYNLDILKAKILSPKDADAKAEKEIKEQIQSDENQSEISKNESSKIENIEELKTNLKGVEKIFFDKIREYNSFKYEPQFNVRLDDNYEVDILLKSTIPTKHLDRYVEIKYQQNRLNMEYFKKSFGSVVKLMNYVHSKTRKRERGYLIFIYKENIADIKEIERFKSAANLYLSQFKSIDIVTEILSFQEAEKYDITKIID